MDLIAYRNKPEERDRINNLISIIPEACATILEIGARDGWISKELARHSKTVYALDLEKPDINSRGVIPIKGDVTDLTFEDNSFDAVVCSEVLEHIPTHLLQKACDEIARVSRKHIIIGVPFEQDIRIGRTTCPHCGKKNPPWTHVNTFTEKRLKALFRGVDLKNVFYIGKVGARKTNFLSVVLMDLAGNPWGTYDQEEKCLYCGEEIVRPGNERGMFQKICSRTSFYIDELRNLPMRNKVKPNWIHLLFEKKMS